MPTYRNLAEIEQAVMKIMTDIIETEVRKVITETWLEEQEEKVYNSYAPSVYKRRAKGGLSDPKNIQALVNEGTNELMMILVNVAKGNPTNGGNYDINNAHMPLSNGEYLNPYIESKNAFDKGAGGNYLPARPYTDATVQSLVNGVDRPAMLNAIKKGLRRHGIKANII